MEIFHNLWNGAVFAISIWNILAIILGYVIGIIAGAIPGVMAVTAMVLILPYTFTLSPLFAISQTVVSVPLFECQVKVECHT